MLIIKNYEQLAVNEIRKDALDILEAGYEAINTEAVVREKVKIENGKLFVGNLNFDLSAYEKIFVAGIGKCALDAAKVLEEMLGDKITQGIILDIRKDKLEKMVSYAGTHPFPSEKNVSVAKKIVEMVSGANEKSLVLVIISGGGSSLFSLPFGINYETLMKISKTLMKKGADIHELNTVRKHLSEVKGGQLAKAAYPAQVVSLIFSDVLGDDMSVIASGPTVKDKTTIKDAEDVMEKYGIAKSCGLSGCELKETPKEDKYFERVENVLIATNADALEKMKEKAEEKGYNVIIETKTLSGEAKEVGKKWAKKEVWQKRGLCVLAGGETTVTITGDGKGGRNQELALGALPHIKEGQVIISSASDGRDNTDAAGAIADKETLAEVEKKQMDINSFLKNNDSYSFFSSVNGQIITGDTGSNVSDLILLLNKK